jgi:hypothetical protein
MSVKGLHVRRLNEHNPREVAFAAQWDQEHEWRDVLQSLCSPECDPDDKGAVRVWNPGSLTGYRLFPLGETTERDRIIAATVVQWLGSNVGMSFLHEALGRCGYRVEKKKDTE